MKPFIDIEPGRILRVFSQVESKAIQRRWMEVYGKNWRGLNTGAFMWHLFSGGGYPAQERQDAQRAYDEHQADQYVVLSNDGLSALLTDLRPTNLTWKDVYVFPKNLAWTMAFTHEVGWLGPYFAKHRNYAALDRANALLSRKAERRLAQIRVAKAKGWM